MRFKPRSGRTASPTAFPRAALLWAGSVFLVVVAIRLLLIAAWAGETPYLDDWNATGWLHIHAPETSFGIPWAWLVYPHADHLLVTQRFFSLGVAALNGEQWDVRAEMMASACLWGLFAGGFVLAAARHLKGAALFAWIALAVTAESLPHAWENLLWAFQVSFILLIGFSLLAVRGLTASAPFSLRWCAGLLCAVAACLSQASGLIALLAVAVVTVGRMLRDPAARSARDFAGLVVLLAAAALAKYFLPAAVAMDSLRASDGAVWLHALLSLVAWPWSGHTWLAAAMWLPAIAFVARLATRRGGWEKDEAFVLAVLVWSLAMSAASAWARGTMLVLGPPPSRYGDVLVIGLLANALVVLRWVQGARSLNSLRAVAAACWLALGLTGLALSTVHLDRTGTPATTINRFSRRDFTASRATHAEAIRAYVRTHDQSVLQVDPPIYPVTAHLSELIDKLRAAHRWPAAFEPGAEPRRPLLSRLAASSGSWAWGILALGLGVGFGAFQLGARDDRASESGRRPA
ncbi:MAG: hypothetical protein JWM32_983 [Verrucomicrobia bacterium]|nr:hypothetical protein [Verrucomicrobiota bacterium]